MAAAGQLWPHCIIHAVWCVLVLVAEICSKAVVDQTDAIIEYLGEDHGAGASKSRTVAVLGKSWMELLQTNSEELGREADAANSDEAENSEELINAKFDLEGVEAAISDLGGELQALLRFSLKKSRVLYV